jgi:hypothetical protein
VVPIKAINTNRLEAETPVYTLGYHSGAPAGKGISLKKGYIAPPFPETLESFLPKPYIVILKSHKFPKVDIDIIYLEGSLLPGYSGAPCVDKSGKLVGVGDGGLEKGASNVSWIIPSKFLKDLKNSEDYILPFGFATDLHFCTTIPKKASTIDIEPQGQGDSIMEGSGEPDLSDYAPIRSEDFDFYITKNRSLVEMFETSDNPDNLVKFLVGMKEEFKVNMDFENLRFDIYEDINYGVVLAVPENEVLFFDKEHKHFQVNYNNNPDVQLLFSGIAGDFSQTSVESELDKQFDWLLDSMTVFWDVKRFSIDKEYTYILPYDEKRRIGYVLMKSEPVIDNQTGSSSTIYLYVTLLMTNEKSFMSIASFKMDNKKLDASKQNGLECLSLENPDSDCEYFKSLIKVFCGAHLTTFAY